MQVDEHQLQQRSVIEGHINLVSLGTQPFLRLVFDMAISVHFGSHPPQGFVSRRSTEVTTARQRSPTM